MRVCPSTFVVVVVAYLLAGIIGFAETANRSVQHKTMLGPQSLDTTATANYTQTTQNICSIKNHNCRACVQQHSDTLLSLSTNTWRHSAVTDFTKHHFRAATHTHVNWTNNWTRLYAVPHTHTHAQLMMMMAYGGVLCCCCCSRKRTHTRVLLPAE